MRIYVKTFGCTANRADNLNISRLLREKGHTFTDTPEYTDIVQVHNKNDTFLFSVPSKYLLYII